MYDKFQGCTVEVQAATYLLPTLEQILDYVHMLNVCHDAFYDFSVMVGRFQTVRVNVHAHALNLNDQYLNCCWCTNLLLGPVHFRQCL